MTWNFDQILVLAQEIHTCKETPKIASGVQSKMERGNKSLNAPRESSKPKQKDEEALNLSVVWR